jgi:hypothetical protein
VVVGKDIATSVEPTGLVGDPLLFEAYRYHASGVAKEDCPRFKPRRAGAGNTTEAVLLNTGGEGMAANQTQPDHMSGETPPPPQRIHHAQPVVQDLDLTRVGGDWTLIWRV